jgi:putative hydrolase of the HAD superfamily
MGVSIAREENPAASRRLLQDLTTRLPEWFGQPESNRHYAEQAEALDAWIAMIDEASEAAVAAFAADAYLHMIDTLCGGDPRTIERVRQRVRAMTGNLDVFQLRPDIDGLLRRLCARGLKLGIVANQPQSARERLARAGIGVLFEHQGLSGLTGFSKPDPRAFQTAAEALGVAPDACIMVGDRIDNDIAPAKALGMATILLRGGRHRRQRPRSPAEEPDAVVTDVLELEAAIDLLLQQPPDR